MDQQQQRKRNSIIAFVSVAFTVAIMSFANFYILGYMEDVTKKMVAVTTDILPSVYHLRTMQTTVTNYRLRELRHIIATDSAQMRLEEEVMLEKLKYYREQEKQLTRLFSSTDEQQEFDKLSELFENYKKQHGRLLQKSRNYEKVAAQEVLYGSSRDAFEDLYEQFESMIDAYLRESNRERDMVKKMQYYARLLSRSIVWGSVALCVLWLYILIRRR